MTTLSVDNPTLLDLAKVEDPDGSVAAVVEILNETNEILPEMAWIEGNLVTGHRSTIRAGIPMPTFRQFNSGVQPNKSRTVQVTDNCGMLEAFAEVDKALADLAADVNAYRLQEDKAHIEGMNQKMAETLIYGSELQVPGSFTGLAPRYNSLSADNGENIISAGSVTGGDGASIYLVIWGPNTVHGIVPRNSKAGLQVNDMGTVTVENQDGNGGRMLAYRTHYRWDCGLTVRDWRYVVRIANIDRSALTSDATSGPVLPNLMFEAMERVPNLGAGRAAFYADRSIITKVRQQAAALKDNVTVEELGGVMVERFHGVPLRRVDAMAVNEAAVS